MYQSQGPIAKPFDLHHEFNLVSNVHPISSDLWEAITGEKLSPENISQIFECSLPHIENQAKVHNNNYQTNSSNQIISNIKDRQKAQTILQELDTCSSEREEIIFNSLFSQLHTLIYEISASFVIQKLCEISTPTQQQKLLNFF